MASFGSVTSRPLRPLVQMIPGRLVAPLSVLVLSLLVMVACTPEVEQPSVARAEDARADLGAASDSATLDSATLDPATLDPATLDPATLDMVEIPAGSYVRGAGYPVEVGRFEIDRHEVTSAQFARFVEATGYETEAEAWGWALVFHPEPDPTGEEVRVPGTPWWLKVVGATWRAPEGPGTKAEKGHPVVQVSWNDAERYCAWRGARLPTEAEWGYAALGGLDRATYPWGDELLPDGRYRANTWQGEFPIEHLSSDGFPALAPVGSFEPNGFGLYDMAGNVWEWCSDWFEPDYFALAPVVDPRGPTTGVEKVLRGGSWLCSANYCQGYRLDNRNHSAPDSGLDNTGFRCAR